MLLCKAKQALARDLVCISRLTQRAVIFCCTKRGLEPSITGRCRHPPLRSGRPHAGFDRGNSIDGKQRVAWTGSVGSTSRVQSLQLEAARKSNRVGTQHTLVPDVASFSIWLFALGFNIRWISDLRGRECNMQDPNTKGICQGKVFKLCCVRTLLENQTYAG